MAPRHEWKIELSPRDLPVLRQRLRTVMTPDAHADGGRYHIRSLYFDTPTDKVLREKIDGVNEREKFRIRYYNGDTSLIRLEKKAKRAGLSEKTQAVLDAEQVQRLLDGDIEWMTAADAPLITELYSKMRWQGLRPKTVVDYTREPFVYGPGNVRVTFDYGIRTAVSCREFLDPSCVTIPAGDPVVLMEVKWDAFLPDIVRDAVQLSGRRAGAFSKYAQCRIYG